MSQQLTLFQNFPTHPQRSYNKNDATPISNLVSMYHNVLWIDLEDQICFNDREQYLKRFYDMHEFGGKIRMLSEYYRYHVEMPRMFMQGPGRIVEANVQDKRALEYDIVTKEIGQKDNQNTVQNKKKSKKNQNVQKMIKDVELSYNDFQEKESKKDKINLKTKREPEKSQRGMTRVDSVGFKGLFSVFKPKSQKIQYEQTKKSKIEQKPKKHKLQEKRQKKLENTKKDPFKSKMASKVTSNNSSVASHQGLNRSKSKTQLYVLNSNKFLVHKQSNQKSSAINPSKQYRSSNSSQQKLIKSTSRKTILADKKCFSNTLSRKSSKSQIESKVKKLQTKQVKNEVEINSKRNNYEDQQNKKEEQTNGPVRKNSQTNNQTINEPAKKMFCRAIQIKNRKF